MTKALLQPLPKHVPKFQPGWQAMRPIRGPVHSLQHPLSVYQQILTEVSA